MSLSTMKTLIEQLSQYAAYHRDRRNILTHFVGVPMIVLAVAVLLARPSFVLMDLMVSPAWLVGLVGVVYYLRLDWRYGGVMAMLLVPTLWIAASLAAAATGIWLIAGVGLFVLGWALQFLGHHYEGRKPAFVDDLMGLAIGPLFVLAEAGFLFGWRRPVQAAIEARVGPLRGSRSPDAVENQA